MHPQDVWLVFERALTPGIIVIEIIPQRLPEHVQTMKMVQPFEVRRVSTSVFVADFDLIRLQP